MDARNYDGVVRSVANAQTGAAALHSLTLLEETASTTFI